jgi:hypothetical protein
LEIPKETLTVIETVSAIAMLESMATGSLVAGQTVLGEKVRCPHFVVGRAGMAQSFKFRAGAVVAGDYSQSRQRGFHPQLLNHAWQTVKNQKNSTDLHHNCEPGG